MFCTKCGNPNVTTKFCPKCGAPAAQPIGDARAPQMAPPPERPRPATQPRSLNQTFAAQQKQAASAQNLNQAFTPQKPAAQKQAVPPPPSPRKTVPPPPKPPQQPKAQTDKFLDGTEFTSPGSGAAQNQSGFGSSSSGASASATTDRPKVKIEPAFKTYTPGETGLFGSMYYMVFDPDTFFSRADFTKTVGMSFMVVFVVNLIRGLGSLFKNYLMFNKMPEGKELDAILIGAAFAFMYPFLVSVLGMIIMTLQYRAFASWKRIFGIYAFASVPYLINFLPLTGLISFVLFVYYARKGFENVFGLEPGTSMIYAVGLPILFWVGVAAIFGTALILGSR